jgi:hypothetical protein
LFFRPGDAGASDGREVKFQTVSPFLGNWSRKALERDFQVFGDMGSFLDHYGDAPPEGARTSSLDFDRSYLVAIQQGLCPTGGYSIRVKAVRAQPPVVTVTVDFQEPGPGDIVTMAMTTPHLFLLVPRSRGKQQPVFRFRSVDGALLAERRPIYGKIAPDAGL